MGTGRKGGEAEPVEFEARADRLSPGLGQGLVFAALVAGLIAATATAPGLTGAIVALAVQSAFLACAIWRVVLVIASGMPRVARPAPGSLPRYTILVALLDEAEIVPQLVERLSEIDYPAERLEAFLLLEDHDHLTLAAVEETPRPAWMRVLIVPPGAPRTKPRALNHGLAHATGTLVTVYDAEDDPDPLQLREAAARFAADPGEDLAALQAPLRIRVEAGSPTAFLDRQFAVEYAALFEVTLPGMARLGLPFPLGGTSNHFRLEALRAVGGWDAHNVTEDADLGFRLWRAGRRLGILSRPTWEPPPGALEHWLPQRTRWLKGFMQTWGVHTRSVRGLGWRGGIALTMTLGAALAASAVHALSIAWVAATVALAISAGLSPETPKFALGVLALGTAAAWLNGAIGARRAGLFYTAGDMVLSPAYWSLLSLAFLHAVWRLVREPFAWDKTAHRASGRTFAGPVQVAAAEAGREAA